VCVCVCVSLQSNQQLKLPGRFMYLNYMPTCCVEVSGLYRKETLLQEPLAKLVGFRSCYYNTSGTTTPTLCWWINCVGGSTLLLQLYECCPLSNHYNQVATLCPSTYNVICLQVTVPTTSLSCHFACWMAVFHNQLMCYYMETSWSSLWWQKTSKHCMTSWNIVTINLIFSFHRLFPFIVEADFCLRGG